MTNKIYIIMAIVLIPVISILAGVDQTKHNFSSSTYSPNAFFYGTRQVCVFCHTVHHGDQSTGALWNHEASGASYQMYNSNSMDMNRTASPNKGSMVCLTCHDGTIAINSLNNVPGPNTAGTFGTPGGANLDGTGKLTSSSNAYVGVDLQDDHPVGIIYDASKDPTGFVAKTGNSLLYPDTLLSEGMYVECISCHNPHDDTYSNFLIISNNNSALCTKCHTK